MLTSVVIIGTAVVLLGAQHYRRRRLVIKLGLPSDAKFYEGWNTEPLTSKWLHVSMSTISSLFKQDPMVSFHGVINNVAVGMTGTTPFDDYYKHFNAGTQSVLSDKDAQQDDRKFVEIQTKTKGVIDSYIKKHSLEDKKKYMNSGLMVSESHRGKGIGISLMQHKLKQLKSIVFTTTTNKFSAKVMETCGYVLIALWKYRDLGVDSNDTLNVYVWTP